MKKTKFLIIALFLFGVAKAQVTLTGTSYTENFDGIGTGYPTGWMVKLHATATTLGTDTVFNPTKTRWNATTRGVFNYASADGLTPPDTTQTFQDASTDRALGIRQTLSMGDPGPAFTFQIANTINMNTFNLSFKLQSLDPTSLRTVTWKVQYATGANPTIFTDLATTPATLTTGGSTWTNTDVTVNFGTLLDNIAGPVWIRIVTLTASCCSGNRPTTAIDDANLTWSNGAGTTVTAPFFTPATGTFYNSVDVTLSSTTSGAEVRYTTDGTIPDETSTLYAAPIHVTATTTINAIGVKTGSTNSAVSTANYTIVTPIACTNIADLKSKVADNSTVYSITGEAVMTFKQTSRNQKFIQDVSGAILIDDVVGKITTAYNVGDGITGITGKLTSYFGMYQFIPIQDPGAATSTANVITPLDVTIAQMLDSVAFKANQSKVIRIINVKFTDADGSIIFATNKKYRLTEGGSSVDSTFKTAFYAVNYISKVIPQGIGSITGIAQFFYGRYQVTARDSSDISLFLYPLPVNAGGISGATSVCQGQNSVTYSVPTIANATSYIWTLPNGATGTSSTNTITVNYGASATSGTISVYGANSYGNGIPSALAINVNTIPQVAGTISGLTSVCQGQNSVVYSVPTIANTTSYVWTLPNGATGSSTSNSITVNYESTAISGNITVKGHNNCGDGATSTLAINVNTIPQSAGTISGLTSVCQGQNSVVYSVPTIANATSYVWTLPNGAIGTSTTNSITVNYGSSAVSGDITVKGQNGCGLGAPSTIPINVNGMPTNATSIVGLDAVCQGQNSVIYTVLPISNATSYIWTLPNGATGNSTTNSITVNYGSSAVSGNITVKGQNGCGFGTESSLPITVSSLPISSGSISGASSVVPNQVGVIYTAPSISEATSYVWTLSAGMSGNSSTNSIVANFNNSTLNDTISVKGENSCGESTTARLVIVKEAAADSYGICFVEFDTLMSKNKIVWATPPTNAQTVNIYTEIATNTWGLIGAIPATQTSYTDMTSNPLSQSSAYRISMVDNLGVEGNKSQYHKTITLLSAYDQLTNTYGFTWSPYEGIVVPNYLLFGITASGSALQIASLSGTSHFYNYVNPSTAFVKYFVGFYTPNCGSKTDYIVRSNFVNSISSGVTEYQSGNLVVYPNPVTDQLTIEMEGNNTELKFNILNSIGQVIFDGSVTDKCVVNTSAFAAGVYMIKLESGTVIKFVK